MARKQIKEASFEERLNAASAKAAAATSTFELIANDLTKAACDKEIVAQDIANEVDRLEALINELLGLQYEAEEKAAAFHSQATNIRALVGN